MKILSINLPSEQSLPLFFRLVVNHLASWLFNRSLGDRRENRNNIEVAVEEMMTPDAQVQIWWVVRISIQFDRILNGTCIFYFHRKSFHTFLL